jgi:hypothetical protein
MRREYQSNFEAVNRVILAWGSGRRKAGAGQRQNFLGGVASLAARAEPTTHGGSEIQDRAPLWREPLTPEKLWRRSPATRLGGRDQVGAALASTKRLPNSI